MLESQSISFKTHENYILKQINVVFEDTKTYSITGQASSGKSLLMKILGGITKPTEGRVLINNQNLYSSNKRDLKNKIGFIFQDGVFLSNLSIMENLLLPVKYLRHDCNQYEITQQIHRLFIDFKIDSENLYKRPAEVSYSAKKMINFIRAIIIDPDIFLINMPLFNLDFGDVKRIMKYLIKIKDSRKMMIMATNSRILLETLSDQIIVLDRGRISFILPPEEFFGSKNPEVTNYINDNIG